MHSVCLQLLGAKPPDPMFILGIHGGIFPPKIPPKKPIKFFWYLGLELSIVKKLTIKLLFNYNNFNSRLPASIQHHIKYVNPNRHILA